MARYIARSAFEVTVCRAERLRQPIVKERPVRQIGQRIVISKVSNALLETPLFTDRGLPQYLPHGWHRPLQATLSDVVAGAGLHRFDCSVLAGSPGHQVNQTYLETDADSCAAVVNLGSISTGTAVKRSSAFCTGGRTTPSRSPSAFALA
jgi:hypothetical protein